MYQSLKKPRFLLSFLWMFTVLGSTSIQAQNVSSGWYLGAAVSALWANLGSVGTANNGGPYPYSLDSYSLNSGTGFAASLFTGYQWQREGQWLPSYALGARYQHFFMADLDGLVHQYSLNQYPTYNYSFGLSADLFSLYTKIDLFKYQRFTPFVDLGLGLATNHMGVFNEVAVSGVTPRLSPGFGKHTEANFAYNLGVGIDYALSSQCVLSLTYDYQDLGSMRSGGGVGSWETSSLDIGSYKLNMLSLGFTHHFDNPTLSK